MKVITLYKYIRPDGGTTVSPIKPDCDCTIMVRLIAEENKCLVKNGVKVSCIDTDSDDGWVEQELDESELL